MHHPCSRSPFRTALLLFAVIIACTARGQGSVVISQVYGSGGVTGATYTNDFIELHNRTAAAISLTGWSVQGTTSTGTTWVGVNLSGSIAAGGYYLVQGFSGGAVGSALPTPNATGTLNLNPTVAKVALLNTTTLLTISCPSGATLVDLVGYGSTADCREGANGSLSNAPSPSITTAILRLNAGCTDTQNNNSDFTTGTPAPRNNVTTPFNCVCAAGSYLSGGTCISCGNGGATYTCGTGLYSTGSACTGSGTSDTQTCATCTPITNCTTVSCTTSSNSTCVTCNTGFTGSTCTSCATNYYNYPTCTFCLASVTCNSHGTCTATGSCSCSAGFTGSSCNQCSSGYFGSTCTSCPGGPGNVCNNHGTCSDGIFGTGACTCQSGYAGSACQYSNATTCNGHGVAQSNGSCICSTGFTGATCNSCATNYYNYPSCTFCSSATTCNNHGTCTGTGSCSCAVGFTGANCSSCATNYYNYPSCTFCSAATTCNNHGTCTGTGTCACATGWTGASCNTCASGYVLSGGNCLADTDGDGVPDINDSCPGTALGAGVNTSGCSCAQLTVQDGNLCNGTETCLNGIISPGVPPTCNDGNDCTSDGCIPATGCIFTPLPNGTSASDGNLCNGEETCQAGVLTLGVPPSCDDGNPCTSDGCIPATGCFHTPLPDGTGASDGNACNGEEVCVSGTVVSGVPLVCDDGNPCTTNICDPTLGCMFTPVPDGFACDVLSTCQAGVCVSIPYVDLSLKVMLDGGLSNGALPPFTVMRDDLRTFGLLPLAQPYTTAPFTYSGTEVTTAPVLATTGNNAIVDWVLIELRDSGVPATILHRRAALVQRDGDVVDVDGTSALRFVNVTPGSYYVAVRHRNHLGAMTAATVALSTTPATVDLTLPATATYGTEAQKTVGTLKALWQSDITRDGQIRYTGTGNDRDPVLLRIGGTVPTNAVPGYYLEDSNLDGVVKYTGTANDRDPILLNVGGTVPTNTRYGQLP